MSDTIEQGMINGRPFKVTLREIVDDARSRWVAWVSLPDKEHLPALQRRSPDQMSKSPYSVAPGASCIGRRIGRTRRETSGPLSTPNILLDDNR